MKRDSKRKGFTLVELLIVIVVIGILSAMMMISSTEAVASAKAASIIGNMRTIKTAALAYYIDATNGASDTVSSLTMNMSDVAKYLSGTSESDLQNSGCEYTIDGNAVKCTIGGSENEIARIKTKLVARAKSVGLRNGSGNDAEAYSGDSEEVYMLIFDGGTSN